MKKFSMEIKRVLSMLLALCMVIGIAAEPGSILITRAKSEGDTSSAVSTPVYTHGMDVRNEDAPDDPAYVGSHSAYLPLGWTYKGQNMIGSSTVTEGDRTYFHAALSADKNGISWGYVHNPEIFDGTCVLSYSFMVDNSAVTDSWTVFLPSFGTDGGSHTIGVTITDNVLKYHNEKTLTPGTWYDIDLVLNGAAVVLYLDGEQFAESTTNATALNYLLMGLGGNSTTNTKNLGMNIDDLKVYDYVAGTGFAFAKTEYETTVGSTVATAWNVAPAGAYIPAVTYSSSNKTVATVDASGVVTALAEGTAVITATPAASSGLSAATATVTVTAPVSPINPVSEPVYSHGMDVRNEDAPDDPAYVGSHSAYLPLGWTYKGQNMIGSSTVTEGDRTYFHAALSADKNGISWGYVHNPEIFDGTCVLSYSFMVDNSAVTDSWTVFLPSFGTDGGSHTIGVTITDNVLKYHNEKTLTPGTWYDIDLVLNGAAVVLYLDGEQFAESTTNATALNYLLMGLGGNSTTNTKYLGINIDDLKVYDYVAGTGFGYGRTNYEVVVGQQVAPQWSLTPANAYIPSVTYSSSDELVATVDADTGVVTGVAKGTATITATPAPSSGLSAITTTVTVIAESDLIEVTGVTINDGAESVTVTAGKTLTLSAAVAPAEATGKTIKWTSSDSTVAAVDATSGEVTGVKAGYAVITATVDGTEISDTITVLVIATTNTLSDPIYYHPMEQQNASEAGHAQPLPVGWSFLGQRVNASSVITEGNRTFYQMKRGNTEGAGISWGYFDDITDYAAVVLKYDLMVDNGDLTGWSVHIPAFTNKAGQRAINLSVSDNVLNVGEKTLTPGQWYQVELILVGDDWTLYIDGVKIGEGSFNTTISCISMGIANQGGNSHVNSNNVTIYGDDVGMNIDELSVYSYEPATGFAFAKSEYEVVAGKTVGTAWKLEPANAYLPYVTYTSSDEAVATVDASGVVTGVSAGTAIITATPAPSTGLAAVTATVTVKSAEGAVGVTDVVINETNVSVKVGGSTTLTATVNPENATVKGVFWTSDNTAVAIVDPATGVVTGVSAGTANIVVVTEDGGKTASVVVTVEPIYAESVVIYDGVEATKVVAGKFITMYAVVAPVGAINKTVKWSSSDTAIATVDADTGIVTGVKAGAAVITATVDGTTITDTIVVFVTEAQDDKCAQPILEIPMNALNTEDSGDVRYPAGWARENTIAKASTLVTFGGRTYWQMKVDGDGIASSGYAVYTFTDAQGNEAALTAAPISLKYSVMVNNEGEGWTTYLPAFTNAKRGRLFALNIADNVLNAGGTTMEVESGQWYDIEVLLNGASWTVYVDGGEFATGTLKEAVASVAYVNTGIYAKASAGNNAANVGINIGDLTVHAHNECGYSTHKDISFEKTSYRYTSSGTFTPVLTGLAAGTSVIYTSTNEAVATVDASGVVTVTGTIGTAMINAYVDGCVLPVATTNVKCTERFTYWETFGNGLNGWSIRIYSGNKDYQSISVVDKAFGNDTANKVMAVKAIAQSGNSMRARKAFDNKTVLDQAVISYDFMIDTKMGVVYLPGFTNNDTGLVGQLSVSYGSLNYRPTQVDWYETGKWIETDTWYHLEQVVDTVAGVYDLYLNGELVLAQMPIGDNNVPFNSVYAGMYKTCTDTMYIDNIFVSEGIDPITAINFKQSAYTVAVGPKGTALEIDLAYTGNAFRSIRWTSSDESVATVDAYGNVTGHKNGTVTITAVPYGNPKLSATTTVTVVEKPVTAIGANDISLHVGGHQYINPVITPSDAGFQDVLYSSSNTSVATVDEWGEVVAIGKGTAQITITSEKYPSVTKTITVTVADATYQSTIYVSVNGGGDGSSANSPLTLQQAMDKVAGMDKSRGSIVVELAAGYYKQTKALNFAAQHGGSYDNFVIYRAASGAQVTIGGAEVLDDEIVSGFTKVDGKNYYVMQLNKDINTRHLVINGVRAVRARSESGLTDPKVIYGDEKRLSALGFSCTDNYLLQIPADDHADLEFSYGVEWGNHRGGAESISLGEDGRVNIIMEQPNFQTITAHSNISAKELEDPSRPYGMFYENALILLDEPGEWYFDNEEMKLYYMPYAWEDINNLSISYPIIDDWTQDGMTEGDSGLINILGDDNGIVQNIKFEGITFADTTYARTNSNVGMSASQGMHIRDFNSTSADVQPEAAITLARANSVYFTGCTFTRLGITGINMFSGTQNVQINGCVFSDISGNGMYIGQTNWRMKEIYNPSNPLLIVKNCDVYNSYLHDIGTEYESASAIGVGYAAYVNLENNEIYNVAYSPMHIGLGWTAEIDNVLRHTTVRNNFIHDFNFGSVWDSGGIYVNGTTSGNLDPYAGTGNNLISGNYLRNMGVGTAALYNDGGSDNWIWEYNVVDLSETPYWPNAWTPNGAQWLTVSQGNEPCLIRYNYTSISKTRGNFPRASGAPFKIAEPYDEDRLNDNNLGLVFKGNVVCEDLNWPTEARNIMAASGLGEAYANLRNYHPERLFTDLPELDEDTLVLGVGGIFSINLRATDGKDAAVDLSKSTVCYMSSDESVFTVSKDGVITATGKGDAEVRIYVMANGIVQVIERPVSVGADLVDIYVELADEEGTLSISTKGDAVSLAPMAVTERGVRLTPDSVKYEIEDTSIARVTEDNTIRGRKKGETVLKITVTVSDQSFTKAFKLKVVEPVNFVLDDMEEVFKRTSISGWKNSFMKLSLDQDKELTIKGTGTGYTTFSPVKYLNELFCFEFALTAESLWPSFALRIHGEYGYVAAGATGYLVSFTDTGVQLQRFNRNERTVLYGDVEGFDPIYGGDIPFFLNDGQVYKIQVGALTNGTNVHLYLSVDGQVIFNCVDKSSEAITTAGYFGVVGKMDDVFRLIKAQDLSAYSLPEMDFGAGDNYEDGVLTPPLTDPDGNDPVDPTDPDGSGNSGGNENNSGGNSNKPGGNNNKPGNDATDPSGTGPADGQDPGTTANNGWVLPVVIASILVVAAGVLVWLYFFLKKRNKALMEEEAAKETEVQAE